MNSKLLHAEWRAVRRASLRLTQQSLSLVGLLAVGGVVVFSTHPEYASGVGRWIVPGTGSDAVPQVPVVQTDPLTTALLAPGGEASRMLGLSEPQGAPGDVAASRVTTSAVASAATTAAATTRQLPAATREKHDIVNYLAKKYRVNSDAVSMLVDSAYSTGQELNLDPLLLLSVMAVESGFNPFAESTAGASGLMQLMSKVHRDKLADFGGANIALNPVVNLRVGAVVLKDCIRRGGSVVEGLRLYVGAGNSIDDAGYGSRVLQEKDRLAQAMHGIRPRIEPIPARARDRQPDLDHSLDKSDPKIDEQASEAGVARSSVAAL